MDIITADGGFDFSNDYNNQETELIFNSIEIIDGYLNLDLKASSNNALISAIAIVPESATPQDLGGFTMHLNTSEQIVLSPVPNISVHQVAKLQAIQVRVVKNYSNLKDMPSK